MSNSRAVDLLYEAGDEMAQSILRRPMECPVPDPNRPGQFCSWPETFLAYKDKVMKAEASWDREPLTDLQWWAFEQYMCAQYGFKPSGALQKPKSLHTGWSYSWPWRTTRLWSWVFHCWQIRRRWEGPSCLVYERGVRVLGIEYVWEAKIRG